MFTTSEPGGFPWSVTLPRPARWRARRAPGRLLPSSTAVPAGGGALRPVPGGDGRRRLRALGPGPCRALAACSPAARLLSAALRRGWAATRAASGWERSSPRAGPLSHCDRVIAVGGCDVLMPHWPESSSLPGCARALCPRAPLPPPSALEAPLPGVRHPGNLLRTRRRGVCRPGLPRPLAAPGTGPSGVAAPTLAHLCPL